jgi:uncharacterized protein
MDDIQMVYNEPVGMWKEFLIISDVHLGKKGIQDVKSTIEIIKKLMKEHDKNKLLILGDLMASYSKVDEEAGIFIRELSKDYELHIVKGNHDGGIEKYKSFCTLYGSEGGIIDEIGFFHGHSVWPKKEIFEKEIILMGHIHPKVVFGKNYKWAEKVWIIAELNKERIQKKYEDVKFKEKNKLIIFPNFGGGVGTLEYEYNKQKFVREIFIKDTFQIYLLNGIKVKMR